MKHPVELSFEQEAQNKLISGIKQISKAVKSTLGPGGNTVLIESENHLRGMTITKDGATVAKSIELIDPIENLACRMVKDASSNTADLASDGTTTSVVLTEAIVLNGIDVINKNNNINRTELLRSIVDVSKEYIEGLKQYSIPISDKLIKSVATVSSNNDTYIGELISDAYERVGKDGVVHFEKSKNFETYVEVINGAKIERGYYHPLFANEQETDTFTASDCLVLVSSQTIHNFTHQLRPDLLAQLTNKRVLFIAPFSDSALKVLAKNVLEQKFNWCAIQPPAMGFRQEEFMADIAVKLGAKYFSDNSGDDLSMIKVEDFGSAKNVTVSSDRTIVIPQDNINQEEIAERLEQLQRSLKKANKNADKKHIKERIGLLGSGVAVIYVGGTDMEQKELYDRVEDAVGAVRSAIEEGVLPGGGKALMYLSEVYKVDSEYDTAEKQLAYAIMNEVAKVPCTQILLNVGLDVNEIYPALEAVPFNYGYNVKTKEYGDLIEMGVVDPLKVTRTALENAVSVATTILSTNAVVTIAREK